MDKSGHVRLSDIRRAYRLVHDCCDAGHDPTAWPALLAEGVVRLVNGQVCAIGAVTMPAPGQSPKTSRLADYGWSTASDRATWERIVLVEQRTLDYPTFLRFAELPGKLITRSREQLMGDEEWYRSDEYNETLRAVGVADMMASAVRIYQPPSLQLFTVLRSRADRRFGPRHRRLTRLFHHEVARHLGTRLVSEPDRPFVPLPPKLRLTLEHLLEGDSEKQVALRMGLSRHTVHEYVTDLYRRFGVNSRPELMALCLRYRFSFGVEVKAPGRTERGQRVRPEDSLRG